MARQFPRITTLLDVDDPEEGMTGVWSNGRLTWVPASDAKFVHDQGFPATTWNIAHNLGKKPAVTCYESINGVFEEIEGDLRQVDNNNAQVTFNSSVSGIAVCN